MKFTDILQRFNIPYRSDGSHEHCRPGWLQIDCPQCSRGWQHFRLGYNLQFRYFSCWHCGGIPLLPTLIELTGLDYRQVKELAGDIPRDQEAEPPRAAGKLILPRGIGPLLAPHKRYLQSRGLDPDEAGRLWNVQGIGLEGGRLAWRLFLPIVYRGEVVSWTTRKITEEGEGLRYYGCPVEQAKMDKRELLYGHDLVQHSVIVNEGPLDAVRIGPGAVATLGTGYSRQQLEKLAPYPVRVVVFDNEPSAQKRARKLCDQLSVFRGQTHNVRLESAKDAAAASEEEIQELRRRFL